MSTSSPPFIASSKIDKKLLLVIGSIGNAVLCVKNILPQDVVCGTNDSVVGALKHPFFGV